ncbi:hypothetical protein D9V30_10250 [Mycetocola reblochoni]|uniref:Gp4-like protein n=2 Tax=Mycetocola reblochoni TaxID=331618 RepID=A0A1R4JQ05_9MICO|nr:phage minor capsid protein [Mycetocola reblochoni]RLP68361.1 hypothetical protein D9V30_10250 [Mycetocola reblochoni]SJN34087.1 Gp4-like protein [Mycetocola reblochoni REB411]
MPQFLPNPDVDPAQLIEDLAAALASHYTGIEARLQAELARRLRKGLEQYPDLTERARVMKELDAEARAALGGTNARTLAASVISIATAQGTVAAADWLDLAKHLPRTVGYTTTSANAGLMLTMDLANKLEALHLRILRYPSDEYQRIVAAISPDILGGTSTLRVTQAQIVSKFLSEGITGFVDRADRRWRIGSYAEMATRTAVNRAWSDAGVYRMQQSGINLVTPSVAVDACERCSAWAGKTLSTDGVTGVRLVQHALEDRMVSVAVDATLEEARAAGLQHPNCRDTMLPVMPGLPAPPVSAADPAKAEARDKLRALEREVRSAKRDEVTAPTPAARAEARAAVLEAQADVREHVKRTGVTRRNYREQLHFSDGQGLTAPNAAPSRTGAVRVPDGAVVEGHERATADVLARYGHDVEFRPLSFEPGVKNPDVLMDGEIWEFKAPLGSGKNTIAHQFSRAGRQSSRLVLDMSRSPIPDADALAEATRRLRSGPKVTELIFIGKDGVPIHVHRS